MGVWIIRTKKLLVLQFGFWWFWSK